MADLALLRQHAGIDSSISDACRVRNTNTYIRYRKGLYVSSDMEQPPDSLVKRYRVATTLSIATILEYNDASGEALVAYWFFSARDSLSDGKVLPERRFHDWDGPWLGKSAEMTTVERRVFLALAMMNMPEVDGPRTIGFAAKRNISATDQSYGWPGYLQSSARFVSALNELEVLGVQLEPRLASSLCRHHL